MSKNQQTIREIDATNMAPGRLAAKIVTILRGKHSPSFETSTTLAGEKVKVVNVRALKFTGRKLVQKDYRHHTMYPGGLKTVSMKKVFLQKPGDVVRHAVMGMLPKNNTRTSLMKRLTIEE